MGAKIVGVVTSDRSRAGGGAPIFYADAEEEAQRKAFILEKILNCAAHELAPGLFVLVDRS